MGLESQDAQSRTDANHRSYEPHAQTTFLATGRRSHGCGTGIAVGVAALAGLLAATAFAAGPPRPLPWRDIPDPPDDAERRIVIKAQDRGPVWLYTGILNGWHPDQSMRLLNRIKPRHCRGGTSGSTTKRKRRP